MRKRIWYVAVVTLLLLGSNLGTHYYTTYLCSAQCQKVQLLTKNSKENIYGFLIVPDNGRWNSKVAKEWLRKPENAEWKDEVTDRFFVTWCPETVNHVAYGFRLEESDEEYHQRQLVLR